MLQHQIPELDEVELTVTFFQFMKVEDDEFIRSFREESVDIANKIFKGSRSKIPVVLKTELTETFGFVVILQANIQCSGAEVELRVERIILAGDEVFAWKQCVRGFPVTARIMRSRQCQFKKGQVIKLRDGGHPLIKWNVFEFGVKHFIVLRKVIEVVRAGCL
jgi:hypothetical protein